MSLNQTFILSEEVKNYLKKSSQDLFYGHKINGFRRYRCLYRKIDAFHHDQLGIVLKLPGFIMEPKTPNFVKVPTISLCDSWVVQPIVNRDNLKIAREILDSELEPYRNIGIYPDLHRGNIGWWGSRAVMFDW